MVVVVSVASVGGRLWSRLRRVQVSDDDPIHGPDRGRPLTTPPANQIAFALATTRIYSAALGMAGLPGTPLDPRTMSDVGYSLARRGRYTGLIEVTDAGAVVLTEFHGWPTEGRWSGLTRERAGRSSRNVDAPDEAIVEFTLPNGAPISALSSSAEIGLELERGMASEASMPAGRAIALEFLPNATVTPEQTSEWRHHLETGGIHMIAGAKTADLKRYTPDPSEGALALRDQIRTDYEAMAGLLGLLSEGDSTAKRELWRLAVISTFEPIALLIETEAAAKLDRPYTLNRELWTRRDLETSRSLTQRATAVQRLVNAGVGVSDARAAIGI